MNTPIKRAPNLQRWIKSVTQTAVLLNTEKDLFHRKRNIGYQKEVYRFDIAISQFWPESVLNCLFTVFFFILNSLGERVRVWNRRHVIVILTINLINTQCFDFSM